ncbi:MAG TPA: 2-isopropylmalate synthase [Thermosulfidibacter takaii]|uniref:2-isopropylmalate synthase n=1 Tax=Thermosulfidibacter takaii TaxID=412593 RepID=A0A7C0U5Y1_9BACT|nr:2-isopropylmalate synthase [Thermosulfidibacter takaii]
MSDNRVYIFDTTLRDGEQAPGFSMNMEEKMAVAHQLAKLGVDVIEAGFPIASPGDFEAVKRVAQEVRGPIIAGLCRANEEDIERAAEALKYAERARIHTFIATSEIHMKYKLQMDPDDVLQAAVAAVKFARDFTDDVEFSAEDATRSDMDFLCRVVEAVIGAGATVVNIPDTVGYAIPDEFSERIATIMNSVPNVDRAIISVHCHNDLGLAVANSLAAVKVGARQVECTVNGIGERAGNASMEEVVMAIKTRSDLFGLTTGVNIHEIYRTSQLVSRVTGVYVQPNKAIVGKNAFAHESGIHQHGVLSNPLTYEIMTPESVGVPSSRLVLGKHSGRHALKERLASLGFDLDDETLGRVFDKFKVLADKKKEVFDEDLIIIAEEELMAVPRAFELDYIHTTAGNKVLPTATVRLKRGEEAFQDSAIGDGPVEASYNAIDRITGVPGKLLSYQIRAVTHGREALGEVTVKVKFNSITVLGRGSSTDIIEASVKAYINAVNKYVYKKEREGKTADGSIANS